MKTNKLFLFALAASAMFWGISCSDGDMIIGPDDNKASDNPDDPDAPEDPDEPEDPGTNTEDPDPNTEDPGTNTEDPGTNTEDPGTNTEDPGTNTEDPGTNTEDPEPIVTVKADLIDIVFEKDGSAKNIAPSGLTVKTYHGSALSTYYNQNYTRYVAHFTNSYTGTASGYYRVDYGSNQSVKDKLADGHSLEAVFRLDTAHDGSAEAKFFAAHQSGGTGFLISNKDKDKSITFLPHVGGNYIWCSSKIVPEVGKYYHIVGVWDKSNGKAKIYVDGALKGEAAASGDFNFGSETWFGIGCDANSGTGNMAWYGDVAVARAYDKPLTAEEVGNLYNTLKNDQKASFTITNIDALGTCKVAPGYHYYVYGTGFQSGDIVRFESTTSDAVVDCPTTIANGRADCKIPDGFKTDDYRVVIVRNGQTYPAVSGKITVSDTAGTQANVKCVAHRGYHPDTNRPENSIASLKSAQDLGVYGAEFDVWITTVGGIFVKHNASLKEATGTDVTIQESKSSSVQNLKLKNGEKVPTLRAYLEQGKKVPGVKMILEIKSHSTTARNNAVTDASVALVKELGMTDQVEWIAFNYNVCKRIRAALPNAVVQYLSGDKAPASMVADKISAIDYSADTLNNHNAWIAEAHNNNMFVNVWTVNDSSSMKSWIGKGVDVITTNSSPDCMKLLHVYVEK